MIAKEFGVLPTQAAADLDNDPEQLSIICVSLLRYADAKAAFDSNNKSVIKAWQGSQMMERVEENFVELAERKLSEES